MRKPFHRSEETRLATPHDYVNTLPRKKHERTETRTYLRCQNYLMAMGTDNFGNAAGLSCLPVTGCYESRSAFTRAQRLRVALGLPRARLDPDAPVPGPSLISHPPAKGRRA